jgi:hypothetical protein
VDHTDTLAPALALQALDTYFGPGRIALVAYHLSRPAPDPLTSELSRDRAAFYGVTGAPAVFFDGCGPFDDGGDESAVESLYAFYRDLALMPEHPDTFLSIDGRFALEGREVSGTLSLAGGKEAAGLRLFVLYCEKVLMLPSASKMVLHAHVARYALSPGKGFDLDGANRSFSIRADLDAIGASARAMIQSLEKEYRIRFLMEPDYVDGSNGLIVAIVQDPITRVVRGARTFDLGKGLVP